MSPAVLRRVQQALLVVGAVITIMAIAIVAGAFRNDAQIEDHRETVVAEVVDASRLRATVNFQTQDGQFFSPRFGLLYPTELTVGQRILIDYDRTDPNLARPVGRTANLSIIPALSVAVIGWVIVIGLMFGIAAANRRWLASVPDGPFVEESVDLASGPEDTAPQRSAPEP